MAARYNDSHDFHNENDYPVLIMLEPNEVVRVKESGQRLDYSDYSGEEFGNEVEVPANASVHTLVFPN